MVNGNFLFKNFFLIVSMEYDDNLLLTIPLINLNLFL